MSKRTVNVTVTIQLDVNDKNVLGGVQESLDKINTVLHKESLPSQPQIFVSDISKSDIFLLEENED